jgi:hypothetical protein
METGGSNTHHFKSEFKFKPAAPARYARLLRTVLKSDWLWCPEQQPSKKRAKPCSQKAENKKPLHLRCKPAKFTHASFQNLTSRTCQVCAPVAHGAEVCLAVVLQNFQRNSSIKLAQLCHVALV